MTEYLLHNSDCLPVLQSLQPASVDAVITDPPYCSGGFSETGKRQAKGQGLRSETLRDVGWFINDNMTTAGLVWLLRSVAVETYRILKDGGSMLVFTDWRMVVHLAPALESSGLRFQSLIVWNKGNPGLGWGFRPQHELILQFVKGVGVYYANDGRNVIDQKRVPNLDKEHQTEKPVALIAELMRIVTDFGGVVFDPFMGSGTTGVAAKELGRSFVGCEISPTYYAIAQKRISQAKTRLTKRGADVWDSAALPGLSTPEG